MITFENFIVFYFVTNIKKKLENINFVIKKYFIYISEGREGYYCMVTNFNGNIGQDSRYLYDNANHLSKDTIKPLGTAGTIKQENESDSFESCAKFTLASAAVFEGIPLALLAKRNYQLSEQNKITSYLKDIDASTKEAFKYLKSGKEGNFFERLAKYFKVINHNSLEFGKVKSIAKAKANMPEYINKAANRSWNAEKSSWFKGIKEWWSNRAVSNLEEKKKLISEGIKPGTIAANTTESVSTLKKINNLMKSTGAIPLLIFSGLIEGVTQIYPTFSELGQEKGMRQVGKSLIHVTADTIGFIAGQQAGMAIGMAAGSVLCPGFGTAIGAVAGFICGCFASHGVDEITKHFIGKSELELAKEENQNKENSQNNHLLSIAA